MSSCASVQIMRALLVLVAVACCVASGVARAARGVRVCESYPGVVATGTPLGTARPGYNVSSCCDACTRKPACTLGVVSNGACQLFSTVTGVNASASATTVAVDSGVSDQVAMSMFTARFHGCRSLSWNWASPVAMWAGVMFNVTSARVQEFTWNPRALCSGSPNFAWLPRRLQFLDLSGNQFTGNPSLSQLPRTLTWLNLNGNMYSGTPRLSLLPAALQVLNLGGNQFTGTPNLRALPPGLTLLDLGFNAFSGTPSLSSLPASLQSIAMGGNQFTGLPNLGALPQLLQNLGLGENQFSGTPNFASLPPSLQQLDLSFNAFSGTPTLVSLPSTLVQLSLGGNQLSGTLNLTALPASLQAVYLQGNDGLCGSMTTDLPCAVFDGLPSACSCSGTAIQCAAC